jgi:hypothetical protein
MILNIFISLFKRFANWCCKPKANKSLGRQKPQERPDRTLEPTYPEKAGTPSKRDSLTESELGKTSTLRRSERKKCKAFTPHEIETKILHSLDRMGKRGSKTSPIEYAIRGIPRHQIGQAKELLQRLVKNGFLAKKISQGRKHVYLTAKGTLRANREKTAASGSANREPS